MADTTRTTSTLQDQVLESIRAGQDATVSIVRSWAETMATLARPVPGTEVDRVVQFTQDLWESERQYAIRLLEALEPPTASAGPAPRAAGGPKSASAS